MMMPSDSVHVAIPTERCEEKPGLGMKTFGMLVACGCCILLGYCLGSHSQDINLLLAPTAQRTAINAQPGLSTPQWMLRTARAPQTYAASQAVPAPAEGVPQSAGPAPVWAGWLAFGLLAPVVTALYAVHSRLSGQAPQPLAMGAAYGTVPSASRAEMMKLYAVPEETVAAEEAEAYAESAVTEADLEMFVEDEDVKGGRGKGRGRGKGKGKGGKGKGKGKGKGDEFREQVVQVRRVTKVVKGGKQLKFRAVVVAGNGKGKVGVGVASNKEVMGAVQKASKLARAELITIPLTKNGSLPHPITVTLGAAKVYLGPACDGTGVIAGGAVRAVVEAAGIKNCVAKQQGTGNPLSNARCTIKALSQIRTLRQVAEDRGIELSRLME